MSNEHAEILNRLFEDGYIIQIESGPYVTGNVTMIENLSEDGHEGIDWCYSDEHVSEEPLSGIPISNVKVMARVDWLNIMEDIMPNVTELPGKQLPCLQDWNQDLDNAYDEAGD